MLSILLAASLVCTHPVEEVIATSSPLAYIEYKADPRFDHILVVATPIAPLGVMIGLVKDGCMVSVPISLPERALMPPEVTKTDPKAKAKPEIQV